ncbi:MAG: efflux RND transporter periplasmic adaptor subunit [Alphaproteobacteria bacterium]|nr:efflux RND transporter periplasmic adaptor subunit [Alphaproteobacteria bacterium]
MKAHFSFAACVVLLIALAAGAGAVRAQDALTVAPVEIRDLKAVFGTVESVDVAAARARVSGTLVGLAVDEGHAVAHGQLLATVEAERLTRELAAIDARITALQAQRAQAEIEMSRARRLVETGAGTQARLDDARTQLNVVEAEIAALQAERDATQARDDERAIYAPAAGRVLRVPVVNGAVVMPGETIAEIAAERFVLRMRLPERHARSIAEGDTVLVGETLLDQPRDALRRGRIRQVYPRIADGRVEADVVVAGLGDFFVGERVRVFVSTASRLAIVVPERYVFQRAGLDFVVLEDGREIVVQPGRIVPDLAFQGEPVPGGLEILSGLGAGDVLVPPGTAGTAE